MRGKQCVQALEARGLRRRFSRGLLRHPGEQLSADGECGIWMIVRPQFVDGATEHISDVRPKIGSHSTYLTQVGVQLLGSSERRKRRNFEFGDVEPTRVLFARLLRDLELTFVLSERVQGGPIIPVVIHTAA